MAKSNTRTPWPFWLNTPANETAFVQSATGNVEGRVQQTLIVSSKTVLLRIKQISLHPILRLQLLS